jgi:hypothetical protein
MTTVAEVWREANEWSGVADRLQRTLKLRRATVLALSLLGSVSSAAAVLAATGGAWQRWLLFVGAFSVAAAAVVRGTLGLRPAHRWTLARATSEELKTQVFLVLTGATDAFPAEVGRIRRAAEPITAELLRQSPAEPPALPDVVDLSGYIELRVRDQLNNYYRPKIGALMDRLRWGRTAELGLLLCGSLLAAAAAAWQDASAAVWVPVLTTAGATVAAHTAAAHYESQLAQFISTSRRLRTLLDGDHPDDLPAYALEVEEILGQEHQGWMTKLDEAS